MKTIHVQTSFRQKKNFGTFFSHQITEFFYCLRDPKPSTVKAKNLHDRGGGEVKELPPIAFWETLELFEQIACFLRCEGSKEKDKESLPKG